MDAGAVVVDGLSIAVKVAEGDGPAVILCHGNSCSTRCFERQLESGLARRCRLIAFDLPGHGDSDRALDPERTYSLEGYARTIVAVATALGAEEGVFVGWSLGGHALLEALERLPSAAGFAIFGAPPVHSPADLGAALSGDPTLQVAFRADSSDAEIDAYLRLLFAPGTPVPRGFAEDFRRTDPRARACLAGSIGRNEVRDEADLVAQMTRPLAILHGVEEAVAVRAYFDRLRLPTLWRRQIHEIAGAGHAAQWEQPAAFNALLDAFISEAVRRA